MLTGSCQRNSRSITSKSKVYAEQMHLAPKGHQITDYKTPGVAKLSTVTPGQISQTTNLTKLTVYHAYAANFHLKPTENVSVSACNL